jgi:hypothetical protein
MSSVRSVIAVLSGVMLLNFMDRTLEQILVMAVADVPPTDAASFLAVRNRPLVLGVTLVTHFFAASLVGYIVARIAAAYGLRHALVAAALQTAAYVWVFTTGENAFLPPVWARVALLVITAPALLAGASIRAQAQSIQSEAAGGVRPEERS